MSEQNQLGNSSTPVVLTAKRKRGRPRKDGNAAKKREGSLQQPATPDGIRAVQQIEPKPNHRSMIGKVVSGVIDGSFDAGYFLSVRIGNNGPPLRGVVFEPGRIKPISSDNDVAPHAKLYQRTELPLPAPNPQNQGNGVISQLDMQQPNFCDRVLPSKAQSGASIVLHNQPASATVPVISVPVNNSSSPLLEKIVIQQNSNFDYQNQCQSIPAAENLRMVEQDEMMQVYEVSVQSEGLIADGGSAKDWVAESSIKLRANNVLPDHKEIMDQVPRYQNEDVGFWPEPGGPVHNGHKFSGTEDHVSIQPHILAQETQILDSDVNQNKIPCNDLKGPYHDFHQSSVVAEVQLLPGEPPVIDSGFQPREVVQNKSQTRNLEFHETPIVAQTPSVSLENKNLESELQTTELIDTQINGPNPQTQFLLQDHQTVESESLPSDPNENQPIRPNHELYRTATLEKLQSVSTNPENREAEVEPSKLAHYDLENQNFGILRDLVAGNHHYLPPEVISDQPREFMVEKPNSPKNNNGETTPVEPKATVLRNNESSPSGKPVSDPVDSNQQNSETVQRSREALPFDLELAAEEPSLPGRPENKVSSPTSNPGGLSDTEPR